MSVNKHILQSIVIIIMLSGIAQGTSEFGNNVTVANNLTVSGYINGLAFDQNVSQGQNVLFGNINATNVNATNLSGHINASDYNITMAQKITSKLFEVLDSSLVTVASFVDWYSCDGAYCVYHPWYDYSNTYAKNMSNGVIEYKSGNINTFLGSIIKNIYTQKKTTISFGDGEYNISNLLIDYPGLVFEGTAPGVEQSDASLLENVSGTIIRIDSDNDVFISNKSYNGGILFKGLIINGSGRLYSGSIWNFTWADRITMRDVYVFNHSGNGILCAECWDLYTDNFVLINSANASLGTAGVKFIMPPSNRLDGGSYDWKGYRYWTEAMAGNSINDTAGSKYTELITPKMHGSKTYKWGNITTVELKNTRQFTIIGGLINYVDYGINISGTSANYNILSNVRMGSIRYNNTNISGSAQNTVISGGYQGLPTMSGHASIMIAGDAGVGTTIGGYIVYDTEPLFQRDAPAARLNVGDIMRAGTNRANRVVSSQNAKNATLISHGLTTAPSICVINDFTNATRIISVSNLTSTTFEVNMLDSSNGAAITSNEAISWWCKV